MSRLLRNKEGCWTCRLRRKKCDGSRPECSTCTSLAIPCYGFGPKPDWMDHGEKEKAMTTHLKQVVKHTSRRKATPKMPKNVSRLLSIAPKNLKESSLSSSSPAHSVQQDGIISPGNQVTAEDAEPSADPVSPDDDHEGLVLYPIAAEESACLMHYLDNVFPLQYPMYKPSILMGGRGWLMALLLKMKPLYHATLALGSYHRRKVALSEASHHMCQVASVIEQEKHLATCLIEFQRIMRSINESLQTSSCPKGGMSVLALVVQLIFFEYFTGQGTEWQIHLHAATNMYLEGHQNVLLQFNLQERSNTIIREDLPVFEGEDPAAMQEVVTFRFLTAIVVWLDIISAITAGTEPRLLPNTTMEMVWKCSQTKFENIIGCKAWVLLQIARIAALHEQKKHALAHGQSMEVTLQETASDVSREIQGGLNQMALKGFCFDEDRPRDSPSASTMRPRVLDEHTIVTGLYTYMASIYLHLVIYGFQQMDTMNPSICAALGMLHTQVPAHILPSLVCPLFVIGCVARQEEEKSFFRHIFSSPPLLNPLFEHRTKLLPVLEETWRKRQTSDNFTWAQVLELTPNILPI